MAVQVGDIQMANKPAEVTRRAAQWRWLIIDEVSMLNAALVAERDMRLRNLARAVRGTKKDAFSLCKRVWGGVPQAAEVFVDERPSHSF